MFTSSETGQGLLLPLYKAPRSRHVLHSITINTTEVIVVWGGRVMQYGNFFRQVTGISRGPFPNQRGLAEGSWPETLIVPTGFGRNPSENPTTIRWVS